MAPGVPIAFRFSGTSNPSVEIDALIAADADHATESVDGHAERHLEGSCRPTETAEPTDDAAAVQRAHVAAILLKEPRLFLLESATPSNMPRP